jgi:Mob1/phocein family
LYDKWLSRYDCAGLKVSVHHLVFRNSWCLSHFSICLLLSRTYLWYDEKGKKNRCPAPQYIDYVMTYTQRTISDESYFPTKYANQFPSGFESHVRKMLRLLFHVIAHMYAAHFREIALLGLHPHLNSTFALLVALQRSVTH